MKNLRANCLQVKVFLHNEGHVKTILGPFNNFLLHS